MADFKKPRFSKLIIRHAINDFSQVSEQNSSSINEPHGVQGPKFYLKVDPDYDALVYCDLNVETESTLRVASKMKCYLNGNLIMSRSEVDFRDSENPWTNELGKKLELISEQFINDGDQFNCECTVYFSGDEIDSDRFERLLQVSGFYEVEHVKPDVEYLGDYDVTITTDDQNTLAHRLVLTKVSEVFKATFENSRRYYESKRKTVEITDVRHEVIDAMVNWIYEGKEPAPQMASSLLQAAEEFKITELKKVCQRICYELVDSGNIIGMLKFAEKYNANELKVAIIDVILLNFKVLFRSKGDIEKQLGPSLMSEILAQMI